MKMVVELPADYVGVLMAHQRIKRGDMERTIRQAIINGTPLPEGEGRLMFSLKDGRWLYEIRVGEDEGSEEE